jgi:glycine/D-amino acid oxidase-like deaminating enzyme
VALSAEETAIIEPAVGLKPAMFNPDARAGDSLRFTRALADRAAADGVAFWLDTKIISLEEADCTTATAAAAPHPHPPTSGSTLGVTGADGAAEVTAAAQMGTASGGEGSQGGARSGGRRVTRIHTSRGVINLNPDTVVVSALGSWTPRVLSTLDLFVPVYPMKV